MMMNFKWHLQYLLIAFFATGILYSCKKTESVPLKSQLTLSINADSTSFDLAKTTPAPNITFTSGALIVNTFKFDATKSGKPTEKVTPGNGAINLFAATPNVYTINLDTGAYTNADIRVNFVKSTITAPLILKGNYKSATSTIIPVEVDFNENTEIRIKVKDQVIVDGLTDFTTYLKLYLSRLFKGIKPTDLENATRTNGTILINSTLNKYMYGKIKVNIITATGGDVVQTTVED